MTGNFHTLAFQELMIRRELAKDPKLATESWDRFLPRTWRLACVLLLITTSTLTHNCPRHLRLRTEFKKRNLTSAEKSQARRVKEMQKTTGANSIPGAMAKKKVYTPFPPAQLPSKIDLQLESGEYFLKPKDKEAKEKRQKKQEQESTSLAAQVSKRQTGLVAPAEAVEASVEDRVKLKRKRDREAGAAAEAGASSKTTGADGEKKKKKKKEKKAEESVEA